MNQSKYEEQTMKWLADLQIVQDPQLLNNFKITVFMVSRHIKNIEVLAVTETKQVLVYLQLGWFGRKFYENTIFRKVKKIIPEYFKDYSFAVTTDIERFEKSLQLVKKALNR